MGVVNLNALKKITWHILIFLSPTCFLACGTSSRFTSPDEVIAGSGNVVIPKTNTREETDLRRRARLRLELGTSYFQQKQYAIALEELKQAIEIDSGYPDTYAVLGLLYMELGDRRQAEDVFRRGLNADNNHSDLNLNYGWFLCQSGREKESISRFMAVARNPLYSAPVKPLQNAGICALRMGDKKLGEQFLLAAYDTDPNSAVVLYNLANLNLANPDLTKARFYINRLHSIYDPSAQTLWLNLKIERAAGGQDKVDDLSKQLRQKFANSAETAALERGAYND